MPGPWPTQRQPGAPSGRRGPATFPPGRQSGRHGAIRDADAFARDSFPCFARGAIHAGPYKFGPGEINVPISIGGMVVNPGDIVVGDPDGVVAFSATAGPALLAATLKQEEKEAAILWSIAEGTYTGAYAKGSAA